MSEPAPRRSSIPPSLRPKKATEHLPFFDVEIAPTLPKAPPTPSDEVDISKDLDPDSGLIDIRGMASLEEKAQMERRADADIFNLSGGLFGHTPIVPLNPPDMNTMSAPADAGRAPPAVRPLASTKVAPVFVPAASAASEGRRQESMYPTGRRSARTGLVAVGVVAAGIAVVLVSLKLGASFSAGDGSSPDSTATASATAEPSPSSGSAGTPSSQVKPGAGTETGEPPGKSPSSTKESAPASKPSASASAQARTSPSATAATAAATAGKPSAGGAAPQAAAPPAPAQPAPPPAGGGAEFNVAAAKAALLGPAVSASGCKKPDDPSGSARVSVTFAPSGRVTSARVNGPPFQGTSTGGCIAAAFRGAVVPPFDGAPVTVNKEVSIR